MDLISPFHKPEVPFLQNYFFHFLAPTVEAVVSDDLCLFKIQSPLTASVFSTLVLALRRLA